MAEDAPEPGLILGVIALVPAFLGVVGGVTIPIINVEVAPLVEPFSIVPWFVGAWMLAGIVLYFVLNARIPEAVKSLGDAVTES